MRYLLKRSFLIFFSVLVLAAAAFSQTEQCPYIDNPAHSEPLSKQMRERMIELCIRENKKDFKRLLQRSEEVAKLTNEVERSYAENARLSDADRKKLKKAEKLLEKIRKEFRAGKVSRKKDKKRPASVPEALSALRKSTNRFLEEIRKTSRHTISAVAIQSSGTVLRLVKFLRFTH